MTPNEIDLFSPKQAEEKGECNFHSGFTFLPEDYSWLGNLHFGGIALEPAFFKVERYLIKLRSSARVRESVRLGGITV